MTNVLVTAIGGSGQGDQILKSLRLVKDGRYRIFGTDIRKNCAQASLVTDFSAMPPARDPNYLSRLFELCKRWEIQAIFHGSEAELRVFAEHRNEIESRGIFLPINTTELIELCIDKARFHSKLVELNLNPLKSSIVFDEDSFAEIDWFPVVVKPSVGGGGSANVYAAQSIDELKGLARYLGLGTVAQNFMIQEYVGTPQDEFTVGVLHDMNGQYIDGVAVHRDLGESLSVRLSVPNRTGRSELGPRLVISSGVSQGLIGKFAEVVNQCRGIAERLGSRGPLNFQGRFVNGAFRIFEINPRYSGTTSMRAMIGFNEPDLMMRYHLKREKIPRDQDWPSARILRTLSEHLIVDR